ncbi:MAG: hypothetical protein KGI79_00535 [Patescibacteria group bacterium]|nr:hypothetical protein [Patescibacteria group bacterium]MDE2116349.1 hypothetical protein [Patescibacteria group bacterium]
MREFQERRRMKKFLHSRYAIAVLAVVCLLLLHSLWGVYQKYQKSETLVDRTRDDLATLQSRVDSVNQSIEELSTPEGRDTALRDQFGVVKPGERMVVLVNDAPTGTPSAEATDTSWWGRFLGFFGL